MSKVIRQRVYLGAKEYGTDKMREVAAEIFAAHPDTEYMIVEVHEHGGWWLHFIRSGVTVGTANDAASLSKEAYAFGDTVKGFGTEYLPDIRR